MSKKSTSSKPWQHRLSADPDLATSELVASLDVDVALYPFDIAGSVAHATMLCEIGILTPQELAAIREGLAGIAADIESGTLAMDVALEDIHMVIEAALIERLRAVQKAAEAGRAPVPAAPAESDLRVSLTLRLSA